MSQARIAIFRGPGRRFDIEERPLPRHLGPREVLVRIRLATICGSDLHTLAGRRDEPAPSVLGHEGVGEVVALGPGRSECSPGDRVTWSLADSCGHCAACAEWDLPQKCRRLFKYGHAPLSEGTGLNGTYATHLLLRSGTAVVGIPAHLPDRLVASANCSLATMVHAVEVGASKLPRSAAIQGGGLLGLHGALLLRARGTPRVVLFDIDPARRELAQAFGIESIPASDANSLPEGSFDAIFEAAGTSAVLRDGLRLLRPGGTYTWVGMVHPNTPLDLTGEAILRKCARIQGVHNYAPNHLRRAVSFLESHHDQFPWDRLVSPAVPLDRLNDAMDQARTGRWLRVAVDPVWQ